MTFGTGIPFTIMPSAIDREILLIMVESRWIPSVGSVACRTIRGELGRRMVRVVGAVIIRHVAGITIRRRTGIPVRMALNTTRIHMLPGQRETGVIMIKVTGHPCSGAMTYSTIQRKSGLCMVR